MAYEKLFTPGRIGPLTIRNRAVMSPMGTDFADTNGNASPRLIAYYAERWIAPMRARVRKDRPISSMWLLGGKRRNSSHGISAKVL